MPEEVAKIALLVFAILVVGQITVCKAYCERGKTWWNSRLSLCLNCTRCNTSQQYTVLTPCELHRDTICVPLHKLDISWPWKVHKLIKKHNEVNTTEVDTDTLKPRHSVDSAVNDDYDYDYDDSNIVSDSGNNVYVQTVALAVATCGCLVFFGLVLALSIYQKRSWQKLKLNLQTDVQDVTSKLHLVGGSESPTEPSSPAPHLYINMQQSELKQFLADVQSKGFGNVYTQEK